MARADRVFISQGVLKQTPETVKSRRADKASYRNNDVFLFVFFRSDASITTCRGISTDSCFFFFFFFSFVSFLRDCFVQK